eukprot:6726154-Pyramimonas_sp.AAC.1
MRTTPTMGDYCSIAGSTIYIPRYIPPNEVLQTPPPRNPNISRHETHARPLLGRYETASGAPAK